MGNNNMIKPLADQLKRHIITVIIIIQESGQADDVQAVGQPSSATYRTLWWSGTELCLISDINPLLHPINTSKSWSMAFYYAWKFVRWMITHDQFGMSIASASYANSQPPNPHLSPSDPLKLVMLICKTKPGNWWNWKTTTTACKCSLIYLSKL